MGNFVIAWDNADAIVKIYGSAIESGDVVSVANPHFGLYVEISFAGYAAGTVNVTITPSAPNAHELVMGDNTVSVTDINNGTQADFVAPRTVLIRLP